MKRKFEFEFDDLSSDNKISFEYNEDMDEDMDEEFAVTNDAISINLYANRQALLTLAKTMIKMSICDYSDSSHIHLRKDFSGDSKGPNVFSIFISK